MYVAITTLLSERQQRSLVPEMRIISMRLTISLSLGVKWIDHNVTKEKSKGKQERERQRERDRPRGELEKGGLPRGGETEQWRRREGPSALDAAGCFVSIYPVAGFSAASFPSWALSLHLA